MNQLQPKPLNTITRAVAKPDQLQAVKSQFHVISLNFYLKR